MLGRMLEKTQRHSAERRAPGHKWHLARVFTYNPWERWSTELPGSCSATTGGTGKFCRSFSKLKLVKCGPCEILYGSHHSGKRTETNAVPHSNHWQLSACLPKTRDHWWPRRELPHGVERPSQPCKNLHRCFLALSLITLYKANPETRPNQSPNV